MTHDTTPQAPLRRSSAVQMPAHVEAMERMLRLARLADALHATDSRLCWAVKNSRECDMPDLYQGLLAVQAQFDDLVARLQPAVFFKPNEPV